MTGICDCITAYKLTDVLSKATRLKRVQQALMDGCHRENPPEKPGKPCHDADSMVHGQQHPVRSCLSDILLHVRFGHYTRSDTADHACTQSPVNAHTPLWVLLLRHWLRLECSYASFETMLLEADEYLLSYGQLVCWCFRSQGSCNQVI